MLLIWVWDLRLVLKEKHKLILCENRMLRKVYGAKKEKEEEVGGENGISPASR
jgi:hypothetical protein